MRARLVLLLLAALALPVAAQDPSALPFTVELVEVDIDEMPGLHSFAWAEDDGKWLFVTGRSNGLHGIVGDDVALGAFPDDQANDAVWVVDRDADQVWSRSLDELNDAVADPLRVTNPQFHQRGETLYIVGGYGTDSAAGEQITFPTLTALDVPGIIEAVTTGGGLAPHIRQIEDERLAVTGGELRKMGEYVLFGGQRFDGAYSVNGEGFTQEYKEQIFAFYLGDDGTTIEIAEAYTLDYDPDVLHRRDMTVAPTFLLVGSLEGGSYATEGYGMYGGVFRPGTNLPVRETVYFGYSDTPEHFTRGFDQRFAHYTCPALPLWDAVTSTMHTTFFGGMAQFVYDEETDEIEQDFLIPFTDDIVTLTHEVTEDGDTYETVMPDPMPGLLGTNAAFIPAPDVPRTDLGIVRLREVSGRTLVGWIVGGIESTAPNPGWNGMSAAETSASERVFAVYLRPTFGTAAETATPLALAIEAPYPNPFRTAATVAFVLDRNADATVEVFDALGRRVTTLHEGPLSARRHTFTLPASGLPAGTYFVRVSGDGFSETRPVVRID